MTHKAREAGGISDQPAEVSFIEGRPPTTTIHYTENTMTICGKIPLLILVASMAECYVLPTPDYDEDQLLLLNELLDGTDQVNTHRMSEDYAQYSEPLNSVDLEPTDEEIVEALLKQLENPAQSEALYEELMKSQARPAEYNNDEDLKHQLHHLAEIAHPEIRKHSSLKQRRKRSIPPFISQEISNKNHINNI